jgi:hypothetical protein
MEAWETDEAEEAKEGGPNKLKMKRTLPSKDVDDLLASYAPDVRDLALAARIFVLEMIPDVTETVDVKARIIGYGYGPRYVDTVCMLMPTKVGVNLGIAYAMQLPDPKKLLEGTGKLHRHVKLKSKTDLETAGLKALLKAALARRERLGLTPKN